MPLFFIGKRNWLPCSGILAGLSCILTLIQLASAEPDAGAAVPVEDLGGAHADRLDGDFRPDHPDHSPDVGWLRIAGLTALLLAVVGGIVVEVDRLGYLDDEGELAALEYVRDNKQPGDVYLVPVRIPDPYAGPPGAVSTSFTPAPGTKNKQLIAVNLQRFRLFTGPDLCRFQGGAV